MLRWVLLLLLLPCWLPAGAAPVKARPLAGIGLLRLTEQSAGRGKVALYREPGVGRVLTATIDELPVLRESGAAGDFCYLPVTARKRGWLKIQYDEAERDAWLESRTGWQFLRWEEFLPGRQVSLLKGLRKDYYQLRREPALTADSTGNVDKEVKLTVQQVDGDWLAVAAGGTAGWLRWRDDNGRLQIQLIH